MMRQLGFYISILFLVISCKKDVKILPPTNPSGSVSCTDYLYTLRATSNFDTVKSNLLSTSVIGSTFFRQDPILFTTPRFNPNNDYEIAYIKDLSGGANNKELWSYNFCTNLKTKISSNIFYSLDWSVKNWLLYTGSDYNIYKVKSNGDSLTKLTTTGGIHSAGKWSPNGSKFWYADGGTTYYICDGNGLVLKNFTSSVLPVDWINNDSLLINSSQKFCSYDYMSTNISNPLHPSTFYYYGFNCYSKNINSCLVSSDNGQNSNFKYFLKYNFTTGAIDTLKQLFFSYSYLPGDYNSRSNKLVLELYRAKWLNQANDYIQFRNNIIIMNPDGTDERMLNLN